MEKGSNGTIRVKIFPSQQLGNAFDHYDIVRDGIADIAFVAPGSQPGRFPIIAGADLPFMISASKGGSQALDTWYRKYAAREMGDVKFCLTFVHDPGAFHAKKKILVPEDVKGIRVRPANAMVAAFVTRLGGTNVQASAPEARDLLEKGVVDAVTLPPGTAVLFGLDRVVKYHMHAPLYTSAFTLLFNRNKYDAMSGPQRKVIDDHCTTEWAGRIAGPFEEFEREGLPKLKSVSGNEVYGLTPDQLTLWKKAAKPLENSWADDVRRIGVDPIAAMKELTDQLAEYNAAN